MVCDSSIRGSCTAAGLPRSLVGLVLCPCLHRGWYKQGWGRCWGGPRHCRGVTPALCPSELGGQSWGAVGMRAAPWSCQ